MEEERIPIEKKYLDKLRKIMIQLDAKALQQSDELIGQIFGAPIEIAQASGLSNASRKSGRFSSSGFAEASFSTSMSAPHSFSHFLQAMQPSSHIFF